MATSSLDPGITPEPDRRITKGTGTSALGPGNSSDSGSDVQSGRRLASENEFGLERGTTDDPNTEADDRSAGPDIGDAELDSDTDVEGTGERATAGRDSDVEAGTDIDVDRVDYVNPEDDPDRVDSGIDSVLPPAQRERRPGERR